MSIFKAYDVRGIYPTEINEEAALAIGKAFGTFMRNMYGSKPNVAVGSDVRLSSPGLKKNFVEGLMSTGADVVDYGLVTTPMLNFAVISGGHDGGAMVTASHNPKDYNGIKMCARNADPLSYEAALGKIENMVNSGEAMKGAGTFQTSNIAGDYAGFMKENFNFRNKMRVAMDAANGMAGVIVPDVFRLMGMQVEALYTTPDGRFPNHPADTTDKANFNDLVKLVKEKKAAVGFMFDGDADRVSVVDDTGRLVLDNHTFALLIKHFLVKSPGSRVVYEVSCSRVVEETIQASGGIPVICKVGHTYIHEKMKEKNAVMGGETSGHYFFRGTRFTDDAMFAALSLLKIMDDSGKKLSALVDSLPKYPYSVVKFRVDSKFLFIEGLKEKFSGGEYKLVDIDGIKIIFPDGWVLARPSNTEPLVRIAWEGRDQESFDRIKKFITENIADIQ